MAMHNCTHCGAEFEYSGNVKYCANCRQHCWQCGKEVYRRDKYCFSCKQTRGEVKRKVAKCKEPSCVTMIRQDGKRSGYCGKHYDMTSRTQRMVQYSKTIAKKPKHLKYKSENIHSVSTVCDVCGAEYLAAPGALKKGGANCCSFRCVGVNAAKKTPKQDTSIEQAIEAELRRRGIPYQKQVPLCGVTVADFLLPDSRTVIYCDGDYWHGLPKRITKDRQQNRILKANGYTVHRFTGSQIQKSASACLSAVMD